MLIEAFFFILSNSQGTFSNSSHKRFQGYVLNVLGYYFLPASLVVAGGDGERTCIGIVQKERADSRHSVHNQRYYCGI